MLPENLLRKLEVIPEGCWLWTGAKSNNRFGIVKWKKRTWKASRLIYTLLKGEITEGMYLLHSCDNELCVNPDHLREGTQKDNMKDMYDRGRQKHNPTSGEQHHNAKLTWDMVARIRLDTRPQHIIAKECGIAQQTISEVKTNKIWRI